MGVKILSGTQVVTALLDGEIDHHSTREIRENIDAIVERTRPKLLKLDFAGVQFMDSSGIGLILGRYRLMKLLGGELQVVHVSDNLERLIQLAGLGKLGIIKKEVKQ